MNIKFVLSFLLTIPAFTFSMQQDEMTVLKKWEDAQQFVGRIVAFKIPWRNWHHGYKLQSEDIRYANISLGDYVFLRTPEEEEHYNLLYPLEHAKTGSYFIQLTTRILAKDNLSVRLADAQELRQIRQAIDDNKALMKIGIDDYKNQSREIVNRNLEQLEVSQK